MSLEICRICFNKNEEYIEVFSEEGYRRNVKAIVEQHFWFKIEQEDEDSKQICSICWKIIESFHDFYTKINNIHNSLIPKSSLETHSVKSEVDLDDEHEHTTEIKTETYEINEVLDDHQPIVADEDFESNDSNDNDDDVSEYESDESETGSADGDEEVRTKKIRQAHKMHENQPTNSHKKRISYMDDVDRLHVCGFCNKSFKQLIKLQDHLNTHTTEYSTSNPIDKKDLFIVWKKNQQDMNVLEHVCSFYQIDESLLPRYAKIKLKSKVHDLCKNFKRMWTNTHRLANDMAKFFEQHSTAFNNIFVLPNDILQYAALASGAGRPENSFEEISSPQKREEVADLKHLGDD